MKKGLNKLPKQVYHSPTAHRLHTRVENIRHGANAALNGYVDFLEKGCLHVIDNAEKAGRDLRRHAMRMAYEAAVHVAEAGSGFVRAAGGVVAQGAEDAASSARKVTKKAGSRVRGAARKLNAASQNSLGRVKERVGSRKYEPVSGEPDWPEASGQGKQNDTTTVSGVAHEPSSAGFNSLTELTRQIESREYEPANYQYAEPARADNGKGGFRSHCIETLDVVEDHCQADDTEKAYNVFYGYATSVAEQTQPQQVHLINYAELLWIANFVQSSLPQLCSHSVNGQNAAFRTLIFNMRTQALRLPDPQCQEARG